MISTMMPAQTRAVAVSPVCLCEYHSTATPASAAATPDTRTLTPRVDQAWCSATGAGAGLENNNLLVLLLFGLAFGILVSQHRCVLGTRWPWLGAGTAAAIWAPNVIWQATHGWPQLAMAAALHQENS